MKLHMLVKKTCNGSTCVVAYDVVGNMLESMCNVFLIRGDYYSTLPNYHETTQHRFCELEEALFYIACLKFRDAYANELKDRGKSLS